MSRFFLQRKLMTFADRYAIRDEQGEDVYTARGQWMSLGKKIRVTDRDGKEVGFLHRKLGTLRPQYLIEIPGLPEFTVVRELVFLRIQYSIHIMDWTVEGDVFHHDFSIRSGIRENGDEVDFRAEYRIRLPFRVFTLSAVPFSARSRKHGWTGSDKKAGGGGSSGGREDKTVYVGRDSTRYHCSASCHYISNEIHRVSARSLPGLRNESGSSYRPCRVCGGADASEYFVLPSGETYHTKANCSSLSYYVRAVPLSEVEHLGPCSYCGGG